MKNAPSTVFDHWVVFFIIVPLSAEVDMIMDDDTLMYGYKWWTRLGHFGISAGTNFRFESLEEIGFKLGLIFQYADLTIRPNYTFSPLPSYIHGKIHGGEMNVGYDFGFLSVILKYIIGARYLNFPADNVWKMADVWVFSNTATLSMKMTLLDIYNFSLYFNTVFLHSYDLGKDSSLGFESSFDLNLFDKIIGLNLKTGYLISGDEKDGYYFDFNRYSNQQYILIDFLHMDVNKYRNPPAKGNFFVASSLRVSYPLLTLFLPKDNVTSNLFLGLYFLDGVYFNNQNSILQIENEFTVGGYIAFNYYIKYGINIEYNNKDKFRLGLGFLLKF